MLFKNLRFFGISIDDCASVICTCNYDNTNSTKKYIVEILNIIFRENIFGNKQLGP